MEKLDSKILITGGNGFLGSHLVRAMLRAGYKDLSITIRKGSRLELIQNELEKIHVFETSVNDLMGLEEAIEGMDIVIHAAALVSFVPKDRAEIFKTNVEGTENVINTCLAAGARKIIFVSSVAAIGRTAGNKVIDETTKWIPDRLNTEYATSKYLAEQHVWRGKHEGLDVAIINPSLIIGPGFWESGSSSIFNKINAGLPFFPPGSTGVVDVRDVADMILKILERQQYGERYICSGENISYKDLFQKIAMALDKKIPTRKSGRLLGSIAWRLVMVQSFFTGKRPTVTQETMRTAFSSFSYDNTRSIKELGFKYRNIDQTIEESCQAYLVSKKSGKDYGIIS